MEIQTSYIESGETIFHTMPSVNNFSCRPNSILPTHQTAANPTANKGVLCRQILWTDGGTHGFLEQCWAVLRVMDIYPSVINSSKHPFTPRFSKYSKNQHWYIESHFSNNKKKSMNLPKNHRFLSSYFMKTISSFFAMFEITRTGGSLVMAYIKTCNRGFF